MSWEMWETKQKLLADRAEAFPEHEKMRQEFYAGKGEMETATAEMQAEEIRLSRLQQQMIEHNIVARQKFGIPHLYSPDEIALEFKTKVVKSQVQEKTQEWVDKDKVLKLQCK